METRMPRRLTPVVLLLLCVAGAGCAEAPEPPRASSSRPEGRSTEAVPATRTAPTPSATPAPPAAGADARPVVPRRVVFLGDSLTAGLGLPAAQAYPALIERRLAERNKGWTIENAGVSGDTSAGALRRLDWAMEGGAAIVVVALGGNDALRGLPTDDLERNLETIVAKAKASGARVVLAGMQAPPNYGPDYTARFRQAYLDVARRQEVDLVPFLLEGVAGLERFNQADGIHPNQAGAALLADTVWRVLEPIVRAVEDTPTE
jgi:acyl-CoA thioesterase-1